jgi:hypothetical protein
MEVQNAVLFVSFLSHFNWFMLSACIQVIYLLLLLWDTKAMTLRAGQSIAR